MMSEDYFWYILYLPYVIKFHCGYSWFCLNILDLFKLDTWLQF